MKLLLLLFALSGLNVLNQAQTDREQYSDRIVPNFMLRDINNDFIELKKIIGKGPVLLCFWSSCCKSAVAQVEAFAKLYEKYSKDGFVLIALATDNEKTVSKVKPFIKTKNYEFPVLYDPNKEIARIYFAYDVPYCVLINGAGKIIYSHLGYMKGDEIEIEKRIENLLSQKK